MQITQEELRQIIKEELNAVLDEKRKKKKKKKKKKKGKKDACYHKVRSRYDVWPSAYASGALVKCRKVGAKNWGNKTNEDLIPGGLGDKLKGSMEDQHKQLAKMHDVSVDEIEKQVAKGIKVEMEHTDSEEIAHEIAMEHVYEDPEYYDKLAGIEEVYSDKQRRFMCAKAEQGADRPKGLSKKEAEEMCKGPKLDEKKKRNGLSSISEVSTVTIQKGSHKERIVLDEKKRKKKKKKAGTESSKEGNLRDWFKRKGAKGKKGGWVDCNAPDGKGGYKSCGRSDGEKRKKYPACRPTPGACKERGKGSSWGKKAKKGKKK